MGLLAKVVEVRPDRLLSDARMLPVLERSPSGCRSTGVCFKRRNPGNVHRAFRVGRVMASLEVDPERRSVAEQIAESNRRLGSNRLFLVEDVVERVADEVATTATAGSERARGSTERTLGYPVRLVGVLGLRAFSP